MPARVLVVCTGNACRSPVAAGLPRAAWRPAGVDVVSAGTRALVGEPMPPEAAAVLRGARGDPAPHRGAQLTAADPAAADLVLTATRAHRTAVVRERPALVRRAFTLREAGRLAQRLAPDVVGDGIADRLPDLVSRLPAARGRWPVADAALDDVEDPFGGDAAAYRRMADQLLPAVRALVRVVGGGVPVTPDRGDPR